MNGVERIVHRKGATPASKEHYRYRFDDSTGYRSRSRKSGKLNSASHGAGEDTQEEQVRKVY